MDLARNILEGVNAIVGPTARLKLLVTTFNDSNGYGDCRCPNSQSSRRAANFCVSICDSVAVQCFVLIPMDVLSRASRSAPLVLEDGLE